MALKRINMNISEDLLEGIDTYAKIMGVNRSSAISVLVSTQLLQWDTFQAFGKTPVCDKEI